jgi:hypothetical protein
MPRRATALVLALAFALAVSLAPAALAGPGAPGAVASKKKGGKGKRKCPKGHVLKTVTGKYGKKVKKCKKVKRPGPKPAPAPAPVAPGGLFEAPGQKLEGDAAKPFLERYLLNSTFTDCVPGWPACGGFENRYSHSADNTFYKCLLRPVSGSDVKSVGEYGVSNARVEPDGSWIFQEVVSWYGNLTSFEWSVSTTGVVEGAEASHSSGEAPTKIGPLQYVGGVAKDCSY